MTSWRPLTGLFALLTCLALSILPAAAQRGSPRMEADGRSIDSLIAEFMEENEVPGMALAIVQAPYIPRVTGYGLADTATRLLASSNTLFDLGRMREAYTAVAVMQLVESGRLGLDDPLSRHLAELPAAWQNITVRHLLSHASGLPDFTREAAHDQGRGHGLADIVALVGFRPLAFEPGRDVADSATDFALLAAVVEAASGESYRSFVRRNQFDRLGLRQTVFADETDRVRSEAVAANGDRHKDFLVDPVLINPTERAVGLGVAGPPPRLIDGPILASAMDVSIWDVGLAGGILVKDPDLRALLYRPALLPDGRHVPAMGPWQFPGRPGLMYVTGSGRGFSAFLSRFTDASELVCVTLLANREGLDLTQLGRRIAGAYDPRLGPPEGTAGLRLQQSPYPVGETIARLQDALRAGGMTVMGRVDHGAGARAAGLSLPATEQIVFGDPRSGTLLMQSRGAAAVDLPLRAAAWEQDGQVWLGVTDPADIARRHGIAGQDALLRAMRAGVDRLALQAVRPY